MRFKIFFTIFILQCLFTGISAQNTGYTDTVYLKDNIKIPCKILETNYGEIKILYGDSSETKIQTDNIIDYKFGDFKTFKKNKRAELRSYSNNSVYFEGFGNGMYSSINYDRIIYRNSICAASFRVGYSQNDVGALIPFELNYLDKGKKPGCFAELGIGITPLVFANTDAFASIFFFRVGYRYQQPDGGFLFRVGFLPGYQTEFHYINERTSTIVHGGGFMPWYGVSIGYTIQK